MLSEPDVQYRGVRLDDQFGTHRPTNSNDDCWYHLLLFLPRQPEIIRISPRPVASSQPNAPGKGAEWGLAGLWSSLSQGFHQLRSTLSRRVAPEAEKGQEGQKRSQVQGPPRARSALDDRRRQPPTSPPPSTPGRRLSEVPSTRRSLTGSTPTGSTDLSDYACFENTKIGSGNIGHGNVRDIDDCAERCGSGTCSGTPTCSGTCVAFLFSSSRNYCWFEKEEQVHLPGSPDDWLCLVISRPPQCPQPAQSPTAIYSAIYSAAVYATASCSAALAAAVYATASCSAALATAAFAASALSTTALTAAAQPASSQPGPSEPAATLASAAVAAASLATTAFASATLAAAPVTAASLTATA